MPSSEEIIRRLLAHDYSHQLVEEEADAELGDA